jgi:hypothetical protein
MRRSGKSTHKAVYYDGMAMVASLIVTRGGSFRLLAVDCIRNTTFESAAKPFSRPALEQRWSDDDGSYRREVRHTADGVDLAARSERLVENHSDYAR